MIAAYLGHHLILSQNNIEDTFIKIPIAKEDIAPMTKVTPDLLTYVSIPPSTVSRIQLISDEEKLIGQITAVPISQNTPFTQGNLLSSEFLNPFNLPPGYRAISIKNSPLIGVAGFINAGMYVDILWTYTDEDVQKTIIAYQNIKVLSVGGPTQAIEKQNEESTITLMIPIERIQELAYMETKGNIKLILRSSPNEKMVQLPPFNQASLNGTYMEEEGNGKNSNIPH